MTIDQIRQVLSRRPFRAVDFVLDSGDRIRIIHLENIYISADESRLRLYENGQEWTTRPEKIAALKRASR